MPELTHAIREHPFRNGCLTAVEDFLRTSQLDLRLQVLPGFHGLAVLATTSQLEQWPPLNRLFENPGGLLLEIGHLNSLEDARLAELASRPVESSDPEINIDTEERFGPSLSEDAADEFFQSQPAKTEPEVDRLDSGHLSLAERQMEEASSEIRRLAAALLEVRGLTLDLLRSNRWRLGNHLGDLYLRLRGRTKTDPAEDRLRQLFKEMGGWRLADKVTGRFLAEAEAIGKEDQATSSLEPRDDPTFASLYYELVSAVDTGGSMSDDRRRFIRNETRIESFRKDSKSPPCQVSIVMPTWNRAFVLGDAITSVLEQTYSSWHLIVCDDGSTDETEQLIGRFSDPRIEYFRIPHSGAAAARNRALERARGELIAYLDSDNVWHPRFLETMVSVLTRRTAVTGAYARFLDVEIREGRTILRSNDPHPFDYATLLDGNFIDLNSFVHRRALFVVFGGFDESLPRHQDWDLVLRYGFVTDLLHVDAILMLYRRNSSWNQITSTSRGDQSWHAIRARSEQYFEAGVPGLKMGCRWMFVVCGNDHDAIERSLSLMDALADDHEVSVIVVNEAATQLPSRLVADVTVDAEDDSALREAITACSSDSSPTILYTCDPTDDVVRILRTTASRELPLLIEQRAVGPKAGRTHAQHADTYWRVIETLSPAAAPAGFVAVPPVVRATNGSSLPAPRRDAVEHNDSDRTSPLIVLFADIGPEPQPKQPPPFNASRFRILDASGFSADRGPWQSALETASVLILRCRHKDALLSRMARVALLSAFASRVPVIATRCDELLFLEDTECLLATVDDGDAILDAVSNVLSHRELVDRMTERAWRHYRRCYSPLAARKALDLLVARVT